jgi:hypothetical protein
MDPTAMDVAERAAKRDLMHYISPFGSATWLSGWRARTFLEQHDRRWSRLEELEIVSDAQRSVSPPHIEHE